ncbi:MAG TPA: DUF998 domain-containing protein [Acidobacteriota bacterium]|nr:DUF998 domain-containing protein [Acidobacteriota bacterium]
MKEDPNDLVISYLTLRKAIGILGTALPFLLALGALLFGTGLRRSISSYYHTHMGDVFVGTLFVIGFFLMSYKGYERKDNIAGNLACVFAVGTALFPEAPEGPLSGSDVLVDRLHFIFAGLLFLTLTYFALILFTKTDPKHPPGPKKLLRIKIYRVTGYMMLACIALIFIYFRLPEGTQTALESLNPVFWLEAILVVAFGVSWLIKGEAILGDD